jgi:hypothetical protein
MDDDPEFAALTTVFNALKSLERSSQQRVLGYVSEKLGLAEFGLSLRTHGHPDSSKSQNHDPIEESTYRNSTAEEMDDTDGISPIAIKWMRRNNLTVNQLGKLYSLGADEIDLIAKSVPGSSMNARTRSVALLKGMAEYLSTGAARVTNEQIKEACLHYDAYDSGNHAKYLRGIVSELSGTKSGGFTLTARGITAATELIKEVLGVKAEQ